jgi:hypothetical protein
MAVTMTTIKTDYEREKWVVMRHYREVGGNRI